MAEAAVKEPSMEDILSSIRKIISEEGNTPEEMNASEVTSTPDLDASSDVQMSDVLNQVRASEHLSESESVKTEISTPAPAQAPSGTSGNEAAKMAASLASIAASVKSDEQAAAQLENETNAVSEEIMETPVVTEPTPTPKLSAIVESVTEPVIETPSEIHVEMADAKPAPEVDSNTSLSETSVKSMVEEEMTSRGALMSPSANGEVSGAFDRLKRSAMDDIDAKTEAILRPMLREWLDDNLPNMVERLVREEIERVARGV